MFCLSDDDDCSALKYWADNQPSASGDCAWIGWVQTAIDNFVDDTPCSNTKKVVCDLTATTTPSPTQPGEFTCDSVGTGDFNGVPLFIQVRSK